MTDIYDSQPVDTPDPMDWIDEGGEPDRAVRWIVGAGLFTAALIAGAVAWWLK